MATPSPFRPLTALLLAAAMTLAAAPQSLAGPKVPPVDEGVHDPSLLAFRLEMQEAVTARDLGAVLARVSPEILNSFGGSGGIEEFREAWRVEEGAPALWPVLASMLAGGGMILRHPEGNTGRIGCGPSFLGPWWYAAWPKRIEPYARALAIGPDVPVQERPDADGPPVASLSWEIVESGEPQDGWLPVTLEDGRGGWVREEEMRSAQGWHIMLERCDGQWWIEALVRGD
ncbi:hypothetical protein SH611_20110 [Geminicoccaceae bacterium 1502E]|nr:hypothetical protein [Geminicoccaceae bacterium 1502E]